MQARGAWVKLGKGYPSRKAVTRAAFDVLAPVQGYGHRSPVYEVAKEETPTPEEVWALAKEIACAVKKRLERFEMDEELC